ncbi:hypothetical protein LshimejAT787_0200660 [Lyophyllum shimeji]|uniref:Uncharacterized protein n=1 Tax=Lyophyllum shimeji TaxID=47721 RepID=A0A9P3PFH1_LYOSH|nr:hypothetical protein LshimejAT787_0200660 [Lyophyllum shimeji]
MEQPLVPVGTTRLAANVSLGAPEGLRRPSKTSPASGTEFLLRPDRVLSTSGASDPETLCTAGILCLLNIREKNSAGLCT